MYPHVSSSNLSTSPSTTPAHPPLSSSISPPHQIFNLLLPSTMATLLRKVWESVSTRSSSTSHSPLQLTSYSPTSSDSSFGPCFDSIPLDILLQILRLVGPKDAIKLGRVCRAWRFLVSDNRLWIYFLQSHQCHDNPWDSVFFAELNLRSGYPLQFVPFPLLPFFT